MSSDYSYLPAHILQMHVYKRAIMSHSTDTPRPRPAPDLRPNPARVVPGVQVLVLVPTRNVPSPGTSKKEPEPGDNRPGDLLAQTPPRR